MRIHTNTAAQGASRHLNNVNDQLNHSIERLSSGYRINRAADDAAGLTVSENLRSEMRGLQQASRNAMDGVSFVQTAEGSLQEVTSILQRTRELAVTAANTATSDGTAEQAEFTELLAEIDSIAGDTTFSGETVFDGTARSFHVGADEGQTTEITFDQISGEDLGIDSVDLSSDADGAIGTIENALDTVLDLRSNLGASQNRLESTLANIGVVVENLTASESRIRDADLAQEMVSFTQNQVLSQAGTSMLAQANQMPSSVLQLLG